MPSGLSREKPTVYGRRRGFNLTSNVPSNILRSDLVELFPSTGRPPMSQQASDGLTIQRWAANVRGLSFVCGACSTAWPSITLLVRRLFLSLW